MNTDGTMNGTLMLMSGSLEDRKTIERLRRELEVARDAALRSAAALETARRSHRKDIALIGETLISEANDRDWCEEYDQIIEGLNRQLTVELPTRERDYNVTVYMRVEMTVSARDDDAARSMAHSIASDIEGTIDHGDFTDNEGNRPGSCTSYVDNYNTEVEAA